MAADGSRTVVCLFHPDAVEHVMVADGATSPAAPSSSCAKDTLMCGIAGLLAPRTELRSRSASAKSPFATRSVPTAPPSRRS